MLVRQGTDFFSRGIAMKKTILKTGEMLFSGDGTITEAITASGFARGFAANTCFGLFISEWHTKLFSVLAENDVDAVWFDENGQRPAIDLDTLL